VIGPEPDRLDCRGMSRRNNNRGERDTSNTQAHVQSASPHCNQRRLHDEQHDPERQGDPMHLQTRSEWREVEPRTQIEGP
jgi:hypothetical protein